MSYNPTQNPSNWQPSGSQPNISGDPASPNSGYLENFKPSLSQDEIRTLKECNAESFYYRCIPMSVLFSGMAYIAMKNGYLKISPSYGYFPKVFTGIILGYLGGKISYQSVCAEKIMKLPNSQLGENLRRRRGQLTFQESLNKEPGFQLITPSEEYLKDETIFDERRPDHSEHNEGIDGYNKVTESLSPYSDTEEALIDKRPSVSYDDLRRENREEYANKIAEKYRRQAPEPSRQPNMTASFPGSSPSAAFPTDPSSSPKPEPYFNPKKNKYGDVWDD